MGAQVLGTGKVAVITGGASGIGRALAEAFGARGSSIALADIDAQRLESTAAELTAAGIDVMTAVTDVSAAESLQNLADAVLDQFGRVDVLCNNAGVSTFNTISDQTLDDWRWVVDVNIWGVVHGLRAFLPILQRQDTPAYIVNTASEGGLISGVPFIAPYAMTKAAVISLSETLKQEMQIAEAPIGVSVLCPGATVSDILDVERVRPESFGQENRGEVAESVRLAIKEMCYGEFGTSAEDVAGQVVRAIDEDEFWIITHPWQRQIVEDRYKAMISRYPDMPAAT